MGCAGVETGDKAGKGGADEMEEGGEDERMQLQMQVPPLPPRAKREHLVRG